MFNNLNRAGNLSPLETRHFNKSTSSLTISSISQLKVKKDIKNVIIKSLDTIQEVSGAEQGVRWLSVALLTEWIVILHKSMPRPLKCLNYRSES